MPFQSLIQLLAVIGIIVLGAWLVLRPEPMDRPEAPAGATGPLIAGTDVLPECAEAAQSAGLREAIGIRLAALGEEGAPAEIAQRLILGEIGETAFNEDAQRRSCTAAVTAGEPGTLGNGYAASFDVAWTNEDDREWAATLLAIERTTLPTCDNKAVLDIVRQNIALNVAGNTASRAARDAIADAIAFADVGQTAFDAEAQRRNCRATVSMVFQGEVLETGRPATWLIHWGTRPTGTVLIEVQY